MSDKGVKFFTNMFDTQLKYFAYISTYIDVQWVKNQHQDSILTIAEFS